MKCSHSTAETVSTPYLCKVARIEAISPEVVDVFTLSLRLRDSGETWESYLPGQFNMLYVPGCGEVAISISGSLPSREVLFHTIRKVGRVTEAIANLKVGDELGVRGPYGSSWPTESCRGSDVILVAGGLGLAPLRPAIEAILQDRDAYRQVTLLIGARSPDLLLFPNDYARWRNAGIDLQLTVDRDPDDLGYTIGVVPLLIDRLNVKAPEKTQVMICGPEIMMEYSARSLLKHGIPAKSLFLSMERNMQCAVGFCGHCQIGPEFVCKDGPVLAYPRVQPYWQVRDL